MRLVLVLASLATPVTAWEFTPGLPCVLNHVEDGIAVELTHDPTQPLFTITLTRPTPWPEAEIFALSFQGGSDLTITTNRHELSDAGRSLTVTDRGFGNVLNGLILNDTATALIGGAAVPFSLTGADGPTRAFADCAVDPAV
ncbi:MAG: hypothetical protein WAO69_02520 [Aestuariivita sp.]|uniref:hypothetical protein n=1 Tax=Aestuariivita sp. TaxID=1872407 RepID=UPI003BB16181